MTAADASHRDNLRCSRHDEPMTVDWTRELSGQFDLQWNLTHGPSLETLTDEEYLWEPFPAAGASARLDPAAAARSSRRGQILSRRR